MSAPLVVNTRDGACWTRRTVTEGGIALYALADVCQCPEFVMATLAELAERGIVGSADALPVPVVPVPQALPSLSGPVCSHAEARAAGLDVAPSVEELNAMAESIVALGDPLSAEVSLARAVPLLGAAVTGLRARAAELEAERERRRLRLVALQNDALNMRGSLSPMGEDRKVPFPLGETLTPAVDWLIARVAELEARPSPADVLRQAADDLTAACPEHSDADEAWMDCPCEFADELRRKADLFGSGEGLCACPAAGRLHQVGCPLDGVPGPGERPVNGLTAVFAPTQVLGYEERAARESDPGRRMAWRMLAEPGGEFDAYLRHPYTTSHDRPETGGA